MLQFRATCGLISWIVPLLALTRSTLATDATWGDVSRYANVLHNVIINIGPAACTYVDVVYPAAERNTNSSSNSYTITAIQAEDLTAQGNAAPTDCVDVVIVDGGIGYQRATIRFKQRCLSDCYLIAATFSLRIYGFEF